MPREDKVCFLAGTRIASPKGSICVEDLTVGSMVFTLSGDTRAIRWLGHRGLDCRRYADPSLVWPYRVQAGSFEEGMPERDLWLSRGHSIYVEGALIQVDRLVNGATITQVPRDQVEYWHVELDDHDVLLAEGLPAESYLDVGNRPGFANGGAFIEAYPDFMPRHESETCVPIVKEGPLLARVRAKLLDRAKTLGYRLTDDADLHVIADSRRVEPIRLSATRLEFRLPDAKDVELRSRSFVPAQIDLASEDARTLGFAVTEVELDGAAVALESEAVLGECYPVEQDDGGRQWRWSRGNQRLPAGTRHVVIELYQLGPKYWLPSGAADVPSLAAAG